MPDHSTGPILDPTQPRPVRVATAPGLPPYVQQELETLDLPVGVADATGVTLDATRHDVMRMNLHLRTAVRVLEPVATFRCSDPDTLHRELMNVPWERIIPDDGYVCVVSAVDTPAIDNTMFANVRVKDAIVDRIAAERGRRPDSGPEQHRAVVHLYWVGDRVVVSLDTSGIKLSDRGYRRRPHVAPLRESLAAAIIMATGYDGTGPLVLPMCGSGTLAIEAALIALRRAPGLLRANFAFMHLLDFDAEAWEGLRRDARKVGRKSPRPAPIVATDLDPDAIEAARANATTAGVDHLIDFGVCDIAETAVPEGDGRIVIVNPPYGERLGETRPLEALYGRIGDFMKQRGGAGRGYVLTGNRDLAKCVGLRAKRRIPFFNSRIECRLLEYELYAGTRRTAHDAAFDGD